MTIDELVEVLQPLAGWHVRSVSSKLNSEFQCYEVRRLERRERWGKSNVILTSTKKPVFDRVYGLAFLAKNITRVTWVGNRARLVTKDGRLGWIQRMEPIEDSGNGILPVGVVARGKPMIQITEGDQDA